jgi:molecular chaperone DnaK (HSP70)
MPAVAQALKEEFGFDGQLTDPDLAVAKGAALYGQKKEIEQLILDELVGTGKIEAGQSINDAQGADIEKVVSDAAASYGMPTESVSDLVETEVQNVCSRGFGLVLQRDNSEEHYASFLTHRNDRLPLVVTDTFYTVEDDQKEVYLQVFEQAGSEESERLEDNNILIGGSLAGIPPGHKKGTAVNVSFSMGSDGTLDVTARHVAMDTPLVLKVETGAALSPETIAAERDQVSLIKPKS